MLAKGDCQREGAAQLRQHLAHRLLRRGALLDQLRDHVGDHFGVGFALEGATALLQRLAQLAEVLDNPVMHQRHFAGRVRMGILLRRRTMGGPAGMGNAGIAGGRIGLQLRHQPRQLAFRPAAHQLAFVKRADAGAVIAAIFHAAQAIDQPRGDVMFADNPDNSAHWGRP